MGKRQLAGLLAAMTLLSLSGCVFGNVDEMYALPRSSEAYVNLQAKINQEKGSAEYIAPLSGENCQTIQLVDVDGDGTQEAVAFFRDNSSATPLIITIFKQDERGEYQTYARIQGIGSDIEFIDYLDLGGAGGGDLLVSWKVNSSIHSLVGYTLSGGQASEIMRSSYSRCITADLDSDGQQEVILAQTGSTGLIERIECYNNTDGHMTLAASAPLSPGATDINSWTGGALDGGTPALFVTAYSGKNTLVTDIFCLTEEGLRNIALAADSSRSGNTFYSATNIQPEDMDGDGCLEVPVAQTVEAYGESSQNQFWWLQWRRYKADGTYETAMTTYHSGDNWYLEIPAAWTGDFSMCLQESSTLGLRTITFARGTENKTEEGEEAEGTSPVPFLEICRLTGSDRTQQAQQNGRFILYSDAATIYTGELLTSDWDCGLDQEGLKALFHTSLSSWQ